MLEQDRMEATVFARAGQDWTRTVLGTDGTLELPEIEVAVPLAELHRDVVFQTEPGRC